MSSSKIWNVIPTSPFSKELAFETGLSSLQAQLLINRGVADKQSALAFMRLRLADMADPMLMKDMGVAVNHILKTLDRRETIAVFGDYDADGLTAAALLYHFFSSLGVRVFCYIPNRLEEGYGLNPGAVQKIHDRGANLLITVDCGVSNEREIALALSLGMEVVVTDHHQLPDSFRPACPVINPHQPDCPFPFKDLSGVGVAFFLSVALRAALRDKGWFRERNEPDLKEYLDLVALGTVADRVPLTGQNRILVNSGIAAMAETRWPGLRAMMEVSGVRDTEIGSEDLAFRLAPRLNAPGRMGDSSLGIRLLTSRNVASAKNFALKINSANGKRQDIERKIFDRIRNQIETSGGLGDRKTLFLGERGWHKGVLGIVASRLVDVYHRPSLVFNISNGLAVGSARSIDGFHLFRALSRFGHLFEKFGGHARAAGFTLKVGNIRILERELDAFARETLSDRDLTPTLEVDAEIPLSELTPDAIREIWSLSPFGEGNPEPCFLSRSLRVTEPRVIGERHLKFRVGQAGTGKSCEAIAFGMADRRVPDGTMVDLVFTPEMNRWQGYERMQLRVIDMKHMG